eukprot:s912_g19.t2
MANRDECPGVPMTEIGDILPVFSSYASSASEVDGRSFTKLCKDCGLYDRNFSSTDADLIFARVVPKGQRRISITEFEKAMGLIAERRNCTQELGNDKNQLCWAGPKAVLEEVMQRIADGAGPSLEGTKADAVRLHDDKHTYTGVHARGGPDSVPKGYGHVPGTGSLSLGRKDSLTRRPSLSRTSSGAACPLPNLLAAASPAVERKLSRSSSTGFLRPQALEKAATISRREGCGLLENVFDAYCTPGQSEMDGKCFVKLMKDSKMIGSRFTTTDADLTFAKVLAKGVRRIDFLQFKAALLIVADKKNIEAGEVFEAVARQFAGPQLSGTRTESVRFHDDTKLQCCSNRQRLRHRQCASVVISHVVSRGQTNAGGRGHRAQPWQIRLCSAAVASNFGWFHRALEHRAAAGVLSLLGPESSFCGLFLGFSSYLFLPSSHTKSVRLARSSPRTQFARGDTHRHQQPPVLQFLSITERLKCLLKLIHILQSQRCSDAAYD